MKPLVSRAITTGIACIVAGGLLWGAWEYDKSLPKTNRQRKLPIEEMVSPNPLTEAEREALRSRAQTGNTVQLDQGAWVQVAGKDGRVAQQYVASKIDPQPGAFMGMGEPRAVFYMDDGRVATLRAASGRVHVPNRALESGSFEGDVVVRMYRPSSRGEVDLNKDSPALILETDRLDFDQILGQLECPGPFRLTTDLLTFDGEGLDLLLSDDQRSIQRLSVDHPLGPIVIDRAKAKASKVASMREWIEVTPTGLFDAQGAQNPKPNTPSSPDERFYRLELHDDVEAVRYSVGDKAWTRGDLLTAVFTLRSDLIADEVVQASPLHDDPLESRWVRAAPMGLFARVASLAAGQQGASSAPATDGDILVVRFTGQLLLEPANSRDVIPPRAQDMRIDIDGNEVELASAAGMALRANAVDIDLARDAAGRTAPTQLVATGEVEATDAAQTLWCAALQAKFDAGDAPSKASDVEPVLGSAEVSRVDAGGGIQIQLRDGARVMGDSMVALPKESRANLKGPGIALYRHGVVIEGMPELFVNARNRSAESPGGGRARKWNDPLIPADAKGRVEIPTLPAQAPQLDAQWLGRMTYIDKAQAGATLDLDGNVKVRAQPRPEEFDALDATTVHLEFGRPATSDVVNSAEDPAGPSGGAALPQKLIATGDVRMENQLWTSPQRVGEPRLFQVRGPRIEYDAVTGEAAVPGSGSALIHIPIGTSAVRSASQVRQRDKLTPGGGVEGTSRFRWGAAMYLKRMVDDQYLMTMDQSVELVRAGFESGDTMTMTTDRLEATLARAPGAQPTRDDQPFNLGGSSELQRVRGVGRCFIRTPQYDVECEEFDYNMVTQIAQLRAKPGRLVNVLPKGQGAPMRAAAMTWDMASGRIQIRSGSGTVGR